MTPATLFEEQLANGKGDTMIDMMLRTIHICSMPLILSLPTLHTSPPNSAPPAVPKITTPPIKEWMVVIISKNRQNTMSECFFFTTNVYSE